MGAHRRPCHIGPFCSPIHQGPRFRCRRGGRRRGYQPVEILEQDYVERLSGVRLERGGSDVIVDLLFASSGIENEVVASATRL